MEPMKAPSKQSVIETPQTPQAMFIPDQGTTPMRRKIERRTQVDEVDLMTLSVFEFGSPSNAERVIARARGKNWVRKGARGFESMVAQAEPIVVRVVRSMVARTGGKRTPARTF